ncbi:MAG: hypothetical protein AB7U61_09635 [Methylocystis sp.]
MQRSLIALAGAAGVAFFSLGPTYSLAASEPSPAPGGVEAQKLADAQPKPVETAPAPHASAPAPDALGPQTADAPRSKAPRPAPAHRGVKEAKPSQSYAICKPVAAVHKRRHRAQRLASRAFLAPAYSQAPGAIRVARGFPIILGISY